MRKFGTLAASLCLAGGLGWAGNFTGRLMDDACYNTQKVDSRESGHKTYKSITKTCAATPSTTAFAVRVTDNPYDEYLGSTIKLDDSGNAQAASEMQSGALKPGRDGRVHVVVKGKILGEVLKTASVEPNRHRASAAGSE